VGIGDLGLRALRGLHQEGNRLLSTERFDALMITTYPVYPAWLGPRFKRRFGLPFILDLQDPLVGAWGRSVGPGGEPDVRSRLSRRAAMWIERRVVPHVDAFTAVSMRTIDDLAARVPAARSRPKLEMPIGWDARDWEVSEEARFDPGWPSAVRHFVYIGTLLPAGHDIVRALAAAAAIVAREGGAPFDLRFIGTSNQTRYDGPPLLATVVDSPARALVHEEPQRVPYLRALSLLRRADVVLVLGTREPHYTASKLYPALASGKPVLAVLHEDSQAVAVARRAEGVTLVTFTEDTSDARLTELVTAALRHLSTALAMPPARYDRLPVLAEFQAESLAKRLAGLLDEVVGASGAAR
jgi:hypothetical protein